MKVRQERETPVILLIGSILAAVALSGSLFVWWMFATKADKKDFPENQIQTGERNKSRPAITADWSSAKHELLFEDVHVELLTASAAHDETHTISNVRITVANNKDNKVVDFLGWNDESTTLEDEHGNQYKIRKFQPNEQVRIGSASMKADTPVAKRLLPTIKYEFNIWFDAISPTAKEARLTLRGQSIGRDKPIHLKIKVSH